MGLKVPCIPANNWNKKRNSSIILAAKCFANHRQVSGKGIRMFVAEHVWNPATKNMDIKVHYVRDPEPEEAAPVSTARCVCGNVIVSGRKECRTCEEGGL